jgi:hypothetical protein
VGGCGIADFFDLADQLPGGFGWVVVRLAGLERDELAELTFEAWRLTAPAALVDQRSDTLPR